MPSQLVSHTEWYIYLAGLLLAFGLSALLYLRNHHLTEIPKPLRLGLFCLRFLSFFLSFVLLCDLYFKVMQRRDEKPILFLASDNSQSMVSAGDSSQVRLFATSTLPELINEFNEKFEVRHSVFGEKTRPMHSEPDFKDRESDFEALFQELENNFSNRNVAALILFSDGIVTNGISPLSRANSLGIPVYCLGSGDSTENVDIGIAKVAHNQVVYLGNDFPVDVFVSTTKAKGKSVWVKILQNGKELARRQLQIPSDHFTGTASFTLNADAPGITVYKAVVEQIEEEKNTENNIMDFILEVQDKRQNILLLASTPHPDINALRESILSSQNYSLDLRFTENYTGQLNAYNLVIFHGIGSEQHSAVEYCRENNIPFWIIRPNSAEIFPGLRLNGNVNRYNDSEPVVNKDFTLFRIKPELAVYLETCPAVRCFFGRHLLSNSAVGLLQQRIGTVETSEPLLLFNEVDGLKTACFNGDGLWKWKMRDFSEHGNTELFDELLSSTIQYLSVKSDKSQFRLRYPKVLDENSIFSMEAEVYNRSYEPVVDAEVTLALRSTDNKVYPYTFSNNGRYYDASPGTLAPGEYRFEARARYGQEILEKEGRFVVKASNEEQVNLLADHKMLRQLASKSGGAYYPMQNAENLKELLLRNTTFKTVSYALHSLLKPIEILWLFVILILLLSTEWALRKNYLRI